MMPLCVLCLCISVIINNEQDREMAYGQAKNKMKKQMKIIEIEIGFIRCS